MPPQTAALTALPPAAGTLAPAQASHLARENELMHARLEQERAARLQAEKDLAGVKALLREAHQMLARQERTLTWQFGQAVTQARGLFDYMALPWRLYRLSSAHKRERRASRTPRQSAPAALPAETANAIKEALDYARRVRDAEVILWISRQGWPAQTRLRALCEVAKWARSSYPHISEQIAEQLLDMEPGAPAVRQLAFSLYDAGLVSAPARLLERAEQAGAEFSTSERHRARRVRNAHELLRRAGQPRRPRARLEAPADGPIVIVSPITLLHGRTAASNALHRHAVLLRKRYGAVRVICLAQDEAMRADAAAHAELHQSGVTLDGVVYQAIQSSPGHTQAIEDAAQTLADAVLAATVSGRPRAVLAWNSIRCALAADRAAQSLRVPYGLVMLGLEYFQKPAARQKLSERGRLELKLVGEALANADLIALGSQAMHEAANQLLPATRDAVILPPLPLPAGPARKAAAPEVDAALAALENKVVIALTEDAPDPALARRIIDVYAEIALRFPNVVFLALSGGRAAAAMHRHAVSIGLHEEQMVFVSEITDLPSREQLLSHIDLALFPYIPAQGEMPPLPATAALLECMAHGICPAAGLSPAYSELIETGHDGLQVDYSQSASEVAARLLEALGEPARLHAMGKRARERVQRQYPPLEQALDEFMTQAAQPQPASPGVRRAEPRLMRLKTP